MASKALLVTMGLLCAGTSSAVRTHVKSEATFRCKGLLARTLCNVHELANGFTLADRHRNHGLDEKKCIAQLCENGGKPDCCTVRDALLEAGAPASDFDFSGTGATGEERHVAKPPRESRPVCGNHKCSGGFTLKADAATRFGDNDLECCVKVAVCSDYKCSPGFVLKADAATTLGDTRDACCVQDQAVVASDMSTHCYCQVDPRHNGMNKFPKSDWRIKGPKGKCQKDDSCMTCKRHGSGCCEAKADGTMDPTRCGEAMAKQVDFGDAKCLCQGLIHSKATICKDYPGDTTDPDKIGCSDCKVGCYNQKG